MRPPELALAAAFVAAVALLAGAAPFPAALTLERALPHKGVPAEHLRERDWARHAGRGLLGAAPAVAGVVDFPVEGSANPYMVGWVSCFASLSFFSSGGSGSVRGGCACVIGGGVENSNLASSPQRAWALT
jgi:hypothetical protein